MTTEEILKLLEERLKPTRLAHTLGVREMAVKLAKIYGCDIRKAEQAALLHDFCKNISVEESDSLVEKYGLDRKYLGNGALAHSQVAAKVLEYEYGLDDREVLLAIEHHTVGDFNMGLLEKIIYVADAIEPCRDYPGVEELREIAYRDINEACIKLLDRTIERVLKKGETMDTKALAWKTAEVIDSKKGQNIAIIDISATSGFADYFVITHAMNDRMMKTIADEVEDKLAELGMTLKQREGSGSGWILLDFSDIIVHIYSQDMRERYNLEKLWGDGEITYFESEE